MGATSKGWEARRKANGTETVDGYIKSRIMVDASDCWLWGNGRLNRYGWFEFRGNVGGAHRKVYEHLVGPVPDGLIVRHTCDVPKCVNPEHLELGTKKDNRRDFMERHPRAKELVAVAQRASRKSVKAFWQSMNPDERAKFCKERNKRQMAKYKNWAPSRGGKQVLA